uniref:Uncharacterized protein n=1 Tax=Glossina palpalis gambiensis TaxID=67801 RepID=A0A1B0ANN1_9MUSC
MKQKYKRYFFINFDDAFITHSIYMCIGGEIVFSSHFGYTGSVAIIDVIYSALIVHSAASHEIAGRGFSRLRIPTCTLLAVHVSQIISLPSKEPVTQCLESPAKCTEFTLFI